MQYNLLHKATFSFNAIFFLSQCVFIYVFVENCQINIYNSRKHPVKMQTFHLRWDLQDLFSLSLLWGYKVAFLNPSLTFMSYGQT